MFWQFCHQEQVLVQVLLSEDTSVSSMKQLIMPTLHALLNLSVKQALFIVEIAVSLGIFTKTNTS